MSFIMVLESGLYIEIYYDSKRASKNILKIGLVDSHIQYSKKNKENKFLYGTMRPI